MSENGSAISIKKGMIIELIIFTAALLFLFFGDDLFYLFVKDSPSGVVWLNRMFYSTFILILTVIAFVWYVVYRIIQFNKKTLPVNFFKCQFIVLKVVMFIIVGLIIIAYFSLLAPFNKDKSAEEKFVEATVVSIEENSTYMGTIILRYDDGTKSKPIDCCYLDSIPIVQNKKYKFKIYENCNVFVAVQNME